MKKSEFTKNKLIKESGVLFNSKGYKNTSISNITDATGYTKGAIYRYFENKEDLEVKSFEHLSSIVINTLRFKIKNHTNVFDKLEVIFNFFSNYVENPIIEGGCPLLNVAIEVDETNSELREKALILLATLKSSIEHILKKGIEFKQLKSSLNTKQASTIIITSLEGAIMTSKLQGDNSDLEIVTKHLKNYIQQYRIK